MSSYYVTPNVGEWQTTTNPFTVTILAYDDNNTRIINKQLYIVYDITYDNSTPDLENNGKTIFSNRDGIIELPLNKRCKISIDIYMVSEYDGTLNISQMAEPDKYVCYHLCENLILPFEPFIVDFNVSYISDQKIPVNETISRKYIQVNILKSDKNTLRFTLENEVYHDFINYPTIVEHVDENTINVSYHDPILDKDWDCDIIVIGSVQELSIFGIYIGETKQLNNFVTKTEVVVTLEYFDGYEYLQRQIDSFEWDFTTQSQITNGNLGVLEIGRGKLRCKIKVPFIWEAVKYRLDAWYEGKKLLIGKEFNQNDFRIWLWSENGTRKLLEFKDCQVIPKDHSIRAGLNWFTVIYKTGPWTLKDKVAIIGYKGNEYPENDFELLYYNPNINSFEDVTEMFDEACSMAGIRYFNWEKILDMVVKTGRYGQYKLYAPVLTGLSTRSDTEWLITCMYEKGLSAQLNKLILQREE